MSNLPKKTAIVVVTYNRREMLRECLAALLEQGNPDAGIIVVDNASTDGTEEYLRKNFVGKIKYYNTGENLGGAGGFNYGIKKALESGCDYIWLMDDDCVVNDSSLSGLLQEAESMKDEFGFLSSKVLWTDGSLCRMNIQKKTYTEKVTEGEEQPVRIIMATFVSFFVKAETVRKIGLPISEFFIWADDFEYSRRISKEYPCYFAPASTVCHKTKNNLGSNLPSDDSKDLSRYSFAYRNEYYLYRQEGIQGRMYYWMKRMLHISKILLKSDRKRERLGIIHQAVKQGKHFYPKIEY